jgi:hypothetical protein
MAKTLVGVLAVSIAAFLFAGCGDTGPKMSPAQKELQKKTCDQLNANKKEIENRLASWRKFVEEWRAAGSKSGVDPSEKSIQSELERNLKDRAAAGC